MTRLRANDLRSIPSSLNDYDLQLRRKTGATLKQIACQAVGVDEKACKDMDRYRIGLVPVTAGQGLLQGFTGAVAAIVKHLGFLSFVTEKTDVSGLGEAFERAAHILMLADDERFLAINTNPWRVIDNARATGKGFATALAMMEGGLRAKNILIIGVGRVGKSAAHALMRMGARLGLYDIHPYLSRRVAKELLDDHSGEVIVETNLNEAILNYRIIFDASPGRGIICSRHITPQTVIAAPGIPLGLTSRARAKSLNRLLHDHLEIGVATMIMDVAYGSEEEVLP